MHILPQLRKLERKYRDSLVVIGVHSSKFPNERETSHIRSAVMRYRIEHPVVNDRDFRIWQSYAVRAWPTLMFVDPAGKVIGKHEGEFELERFDGLIGEMVAEFEAAGRFDRNPLPFQLEMERQAARLLSYPGKIEADEAGGRLFVADTNHDRILEISPDGAVRQVIGAGEPGFKDGPLLEAEFRGPQGMAVDGSLLYVADAENHSIRRVDLDSGTVSTVAGTGEQSLYRHSGGDPLANPLNSPYDLALHDGVLYVAMAGFHQLWALDLAANHVFPYAGDGGEDIVDGPRERARCAQPYGLKTDGRLLYFTDSETSSVRTVGFGPDATVISLIGRGLFDFGDVDGDRQTALLQHCQGLALRTGGERPVVFIADTYNHRIKRLETDGGAARVVRFAGTGAAGARNGGAAESSFDEPAGLATYGDRLYVADTNNHAIRVIDLSTDGNPVTTLEVRV